MKTNLKILSLILISILCFSSCEKDDENNDNIITDQISGQIILPEDSSIDISTFNVSSNTNQSNLTDGSFTIDEMNTFSSLYVTNENEEVMLMSYTYPGNPTNDITPTSTALGLVMMSPSVLSLSDQAKQSLINDLLNDSDFELLVIEINQNLINNRPLFDDTNTSLMQALTDVYQTLASRSSNSENEIPVNMNRAGRNFIFNNGQGTVPNAYTTVIGVYKDDVKIDEIIVDGVNIVSSSISDLISGNGSTFDDPVDYSYMLEGDGQFTFKFRTGKPGFGDNSIEHDKAFYENLGNFCFNLLKTLLPNLNSSSCFFSIFQNINNTIQNISSLSSNSNAGIGTILFTVNDLLLNNVNSLISDCSDNISINQDWFTSFLKQWNFINKAFDIISNGANTTILATQWAIASPVVDICFTATGNDVVEECDALELAGGWNTEYLTNPPCTGNSSTFNTAFDNRELNFISVNETSGNIERAFYLGGIYNEVLNISTYEYDPINQTLNITMESSGLRFGTDTLERNFYFSGTLNESTQEFEGDFNSSLELFIDNTSIGVPNTTSTKNCNETMKLSRS